MDAIASARPRATGKKNSTPAKPVFRDSAQAALDTLSKFDELIDTGLSAGDTGEWPSILLSLAVPISEKAKGGLRAADASKRYDILTDIYSMQALAQGALATDPDGGKGAIAAKAFSVLETIADSLDPDGGFADTDIDPRTAIDRGAVQKPVPVDNLHAAMDNAKPMLSYEDGGLSHDLATQCTYEIENACDELLQMARGDIADESSIKVRALAIRIEQLKSVLLNFLEGDQLTVGAAYVRVWGVAMSKGGAE